METQAGTVYRQSDRNQDYLSSPRPSVAVLIPCFNESKAIATVVTGFQAALPDAAIYVYDNASTDDTVAVARQAGAIVRHEPRRGKGSVVRRMFADVDADIYILVDGDATYDPMTARVMIDRLIDGQLDMVTTQRQAVAEAAYRPKHEFGNKLLTNLVAAIFGREFKDMLSGYRAFSRRFVKSFPALSGGFEIETEITIHALELALPTDEVPSPYYARPEGSVSKLSTYRDGFRILFTILLLLKEERPFHFFGCIGLAMILVALVLMEPVIGTYLETGLVPRLPTVVFSGTLTLAGLLAISCALILDSVARGRRELKRLNYLSHRAPPQPIRG